MNTLLKKKGTLNTWIARMLFLNSNYPKWSHSVVCDSLWPGGL